MPVPISTYNHIQLAFILPHQPTKSSSVADPGCLIPDPDPTIAPSRIREVKKHRIPDLYKVAQVEFNFSEKKKS
jgi:hypothetical protein